MGTLQTWRKAYSALKDQIKVGLAHVNSDFKGFEIKQILGPLSISDTSPFASSSKGIRGGVGQQQYDTALKSWRSSVYLLLLYFSSEQTVYIRSIANCGSITNAMDIFQYSKG